MVTYSPWTWSAEHGRHYCYILDDDGQILDTHWAGPPRPTEPDPDPDPRSPRTHIPAVTTVATQSSISSTHAENSSPPRQYTTATYQTTPKPTYSVSYPSRPSVLTSTHQYSTTPTQATAYRTSYASTGLSAYQSPTYQGSAYHTPTNTNLSAYQTPVSDSRPSIASLPADVQHNLGGRGQRFIRTGTDGNPAESLDPRYRRVAAHHHTWFFVLGRVFKMLWTEPAGQANPGITRGSTHFSTIMFGEQAYSEIRRFIVVRNRGTFSQCIPIQTYRGKGATKPNLNVRDHGVVHTFDDPPELLPGEGITKQPIRVVATGTEWLEPESRVNYGKAYAVEHNVKVLEIGMIQESHKYMLQYYYESAMRGE